MQIIGHELWVKNWGYDISHEVNRIARHFKKLFPILRSYAIRQLPAISGCSATSKLGFHKHAVSNRSTAVSPTLLPLHIMKLTGVHTHKTLGIFTYEAEYTVSQPATTWFFDWSATAVGSGRVLQLSGSNEILVGSSGAASLLLEKQIRVEIDALI